GHVMGEEYAEHTPVRELMINVYGTAAISEINVVKNGRLLHSIAGKRQVDMECVYRDEAVERETDYYYVHIRQENAEQAWSSPIWVNACK
ncbi:MAG: hypothetical protein LC725_05245, partial [Lentisphaerae bacterium]|nr:hypothetical protein [Lentisphaerota bacterium]